jgi:hypothetical protein
MITLLFIQDTELDLNGQIKSKKAALIVLFTICIDTVIMFNILHYLT